MAHNANHAAEHATGESDELTPSDIGAAEASHSHDGDSHSILSATHSDTVSDDIPEHGDVLTYVEGEDYDLWAAVAPKKELPEARDAYSTTGVFWPYPQGGNIYGYTVGDGWIEDVADMPSLGARITITITDDVIGGEDTYSGYISSYHNASVLLFVPDDYKSHWDDYAMTDAGVPCDIEVEAYPADADTLQWNANEAVWVPAQQSASGAPTDATYVTLTTNGSLSAERTLTAGTGLDITDAGAGSTVTLDVDLSEITAGGELGGTMDAPTVDATHSGSAHHAEDHDHDGSPTQKLAQANTHQSADTDTGTSSLHHTLGTGANQAAAGNDARLSDSRSPSGSAGGELSGTYPNPTVASTHSGSAHHDPVTVGTGLDLTGQLIELDLSEVNAGGELGGTMDAPTVDATHAGSAHHAEDHDHDGSPTQKLAQANTHQSADTDSATSSLHHTLGTGSNQAAAGNHAHADTALSHLRWGYAT